MAEGLVNLASPIIAAAARPLGLSVPGGDRFGPPTTFARENAMIEIHEDTPATVRRVFGQRGLSRLMFQFIETPIEDSQSPNYEQITPMGRSEPYQSYSHGNSRVIPLNLCFASSVDQGDNGDYDRALRCVRWLQALTMPTYDGGGLLFPPPLCRLLLGRTINARVVLTQVSASFEAFSGERSVFDYPTVARASIECTVVNTRPYEARDYLRRGGV